MDEPTPPPTPTLPPRWRASVAGIVIGDIAVGAQFALTMLLLNRINLVRTLGVPSLFLVPVLGGFIASYFWRTLKPTLGLTVLNSFWMTLVALVIATAAFHEGLICIIILAPVYFLATLTGALVGRIIFRIDPTRLQLSIVPLFALLALAEPLTRADQINVVTDRIVIRAPANKVWAQVKAFPAVSAPPRFWLFRIGLPYPMATTATGDYVNAQRECIFSHDAVFKEKVIEFDPEKKLTFDIVESPADPELIGHLTPHRGQFILYPNPDGSTTLLGSTWYTLHVRPLWYFDLWTHHIFRAVHLRVMEDIRLRAET